jgi:hypothetical protein
MTVSGVAEAREKAHLKAARRLHDTALWLAAFDGADRIFDRLARRDGAVPLSADERALVERVQGAAEAVGELDPAVVAAGQAERLGFAAGSREWVCARAVGRAASKSMGRGAYHSPAHASWVALDAMMLADQAAPSSSLDEAARRERLVLLAAATGHDIGHDGRGNAGAPFRLERISADATATWMRRSGGFSADEIEDARALVLSTDPTQRRNVAAASVLAEEGLGPTAFAALGLPAELSRLAERPSLAIRAGLISDADLFRSTGAGPEWSRRQSELVGREINASREEATLTHGQVAHFLDNIATGAFASRQGQQHLASLEEIRRVQLGDERGLGFRYDQAAAGQRFSTPHGAAVDREWESALAGAEAATGGRAAVEPRADGGFTATIAGGGRAVRIELARTGTLVYKEAAADGGWEAVAVRHPDIGPGGSVEWRQAAVAPGEGRPALDDGRSARLSA